MTLYRQPSGLRRGPHLMIDPEWSPQQAAAVITLLDDLRDLIWQHYELVLLQQFQDDRISEHPADHHRIDADDVPF